MRIANRRATLLLTTLTVILACRGERESPLTGEWGGHDSAGRAVGLVFGDGGEALWIADRIPGVQDTIPVRYRTDTTAAPGRLDLSGFTEGPLAGMTLYGIFDLAGRDTLRVDFEPGLPGQSDQRPDSFTASTITLRRVR